MNLGITLSNHKILFIFSYYPKQKKIPQKSSTFIDLTSTMGKDFKTILSISSESHFESGLKNIFE